MPLSIRPYQPSDRDRLKEMAIELINAMAEIDPHKLFRPRAAIDSEAYVVQRLKNVETYNGRVFVAEDSTSPIRQAQGDVHPRHGEPAESMTSRQKSIIGYLSCTIDEPSAINLLNKFVSRQGSIDELYVEPSHRGVRHPEQASAATMLMEAAAAYFREKDCTHATVACLAQNAQARKFYTKMAYGEQYVEFIKKL